MNDAAETASDRLHRVLLAGTPLSMRRSLPSLVASLAWAPIFTWMIWRGGGMGQPLLWLFLAVLWSFWFLYLKSPYKLVVSKTTVGVHWWYRRANASRASVSLTRSDSLGSRFFGYHLLTIVGVGRFPVWPAYFVVVEQGQPTD
jgi:hypothetical protein